MRITYKELNLCFQLLLTALTTGFFTSGISSPALAQVISDGTTNTSVSINGNDFRIFNGIDKGNNLFHSFSNFSVPTGGSATFDLTNTLNITTIFSRVTGGNVSNIDGLIRTLNSNNPVSLFLMNPNGIVFGPNASLNIGGSFVGTTASSIKFADGTEFSATNSAAPPLLTMSVPVGLQMGSNAGAIQVQGQPVQVQGSPGLGFGLFFLRLPTLSVIPNQTLALVGGQIDIDSASISAPDGHIELWALQNGEIALDKETGWQLTSKPNTVNGGTITLQQTSFVTADGSNGGAINIWGRGLSLQDGSNIGATTFAGQGKGITVHTTEFIDLLGTTDLVNQPLFAGISTSVGNSLGLLVLPGPPATGQAGNITIETGRLKMTNGAWLVSSTSGNNSRRTGNITIHATDVDLLGYETLLGSSATTIANLLLSGSNNQSGQVTVDAQRIHLFNGSRISSSVLGGNGTGGEVSIRATDSLDIQGANPVGIFSAVLASLESGTTGQGGNISIDTGNLILSNGGGITSEVVGSQVNFLGLFIPGANGTAGDIEIRAKDIQVSEPMIDGYSQTITGIKASLGNGSVGNGGNLNLTADNLRVFNGGQITSSSLGQGSAGSVNLQVKNLDVQGTSQNLINGSSLKSAIAASSTTSFAAGSVNITSDAVRVRDNAEITVSNTGSGDAGNLNITANNIFLDNGANLRSEVNGGGQGDIHLNANDVLLLRHGSNIITNALGTSTGGNININAGSIVAVPKENSDISANAVLGSGGNIQITTGGIFGLQFQDQLTPNSDITASSQFGLSGTVQVNTIVVNPNSGLIELPANVTDPSQKIASGCSANTGSSFVATGRGGVPQNPTQEVRSDRPWSDTRDISTYHKTGNVTAQIPTTPQVLVQATSWHRNAFGKIELVTDKSPNQVQPSLTCAGLPKS
ncbi:filamentous hemagglutinin N-terminal domain-containing protein [Nostoc sphaeroides]|uniref:two-partner secretion domain-containing protein n=1 Tax=Nostoc sphaeroides TaxID=446679 RepID=UPI00126A6174|nr:S-layer family protein [Nostoc sphaeroides]